MRNFAFVLSLSVFLGNGGVARRQPVGKAVAEQHVSRKAGCNMHANEDTNALKALRLLLLASKNSAAGWHIGGHGGGLKMVRPRVPTVGMSSNSGKNAASDSLLDERESTQEGLNAITPLSGPSFLAALFGIGINGSPWEYMLAMRRDGYGGVTKVPLGPFGGDFYFLLEPSALKQALLEDAEQFFPRRYSVPLFELLQLDKGIVYEQGERHKRQKRLCVPSFEQSRSMSSFLSAVQDETDVLTSQWQSRISGDSTLRLDLYREIRQLTLSVILRVTFGLGEAGREFKEAAALSSTIGQYLEAIVATANEVPPLWSISPALSPNYRKVTETLLPRLRRLVADVIAERRTRDGSKLLEDNSSRPDNRADLLSVLVRDDTLTDEDVAYVLFDLVIAGSDTTASTITAGIFLLHEPRHAHALAALRTELRNASILNLKLDDVRKLLPYSTAVAKEVLRLYPPVPFVGRTAIAPRTLLDGVDVPLGGTLCFSPYALGRDPASWGVDADEFKPERWLEDTSKGGATSSLAWLPFGAGPRGCLGTRLGITEAVIGIALLVQRFEFAFDKAAEGLQYKYDLTLNLEGTTLCEARMCTERS